MMTTLGKIATLLLAGVLPAQIQGMPAMPGGGPSAEPQPLNVRLIAIQARNTGSGTLQIEGEGLDKLEDVFKELPFDSYTLIRKGEAEAPFGQETMIPINGVYTFYVTLQQQQQQAVIFDARIEMAQNNSYINALDTRGQAKPGQAMIFRGMDLGGSGELIAIMQIVQPQQGGGGSSQDEQDKDEENEEDKSQQQNEEQQGDSEDENKDNESEESEEQDQQNQQQQDQQDQESDPSENDQQQQAQRGEQPKDMQEIEAILESLEEIDRREQKRMKNQPQRIWIQEEWW